MACAAEPSVAGGVWAEYLVTSAPMCVPLSKLADMEQGTTMLVNPLTASALMEEAPLGRHRAVVRTAAASALRRMLVRLGQRCSIPIINVVRRAEQVELLRKMSAKHVLTTSSADSDASLEYFCHKLWPASVSTQLHNKCRQAEKTQLADSVFRGRSCDCLREI